MRARTLLATMGAGLIVVVGLVLGTRLRLQSEARAGHPERATSQQSTAPSATVPDLRPEVARFLEEHREFGRASWAEALPDWAQGQRQAVRMSSGKRLVFYLQEAEVLTVFETSSFGRNKVWGEYPAASADEPERGVHKTEDLPSYTIDVVNLMRGGKYGDVIVPSLSRTTPKDDRERILRAISKKESLTEASLYSTEEAFKANTSSSYLNAHPRALKEGYLGSLRNGKFTPGETVFP